MHCSIFGKVETLKNYNDVCHSHQTYIGTVSVVIISPVLSATLTKRDSTGFFFFYSNNTKNKFGLKR